MYELPIKKEKISIAMLGLVEGNGHPYSWSAIFNGYDKEYMKDCPYPVIPQYLEKEPTENFGIDGAKVTHIWTENIEESEKIAKASLIPNIVETPEDVIGKVDAVIIPTDIGYEHIKRAEPFVKAGLPVFIDKPLTDNKKDLDVFREWIKEGKPIMSSSAMRYAKEFLAYRISTNELGKLRFVTITTPKSWERYGIHALEAVYPIIGGGFISAQNTGTKERNIVHFKHKNGIDLVVAAIDDMYGAFGNLQINGTKDSVSLKFKDTFYAFKKQLEAFVRFLRTGTYPFPFKETDELMRMLIGGMLSRDNDGKEIFLEEI